MDSSLLANATSADDGPTPGYMLVEIASKKPMAYNINIFSPILNSFLLS